MYAIKFQADEAAVYAGMKSGAFGWAPTLNTALKYDNREEAERVLKSAYGPSMQEIGEVIVLSD